MTKGFQADDWLMLVALAIFTLSCSFILAGVRDGLGHHNVALEQDKEISALMYQALATAAYVLDMLFIKLSIGLFLLRLSNSKVYNWILYVSLVVVTLWSAVIFLWNLFQCSPVTAQWDYTIPDSNDWLYALMPIPMIWNVKMTTQAKATVIVILGLGILQRHDILFRGTEAMVWTLVEPGVAIVASSLVTIRPLLRAWKLNGFTSADQTPGVSGMSGGMRTGTVPARRPAGYMDDDVDMDVEMGEYEKRGPETATTSYQAAPPSQQAPPVMIQDEAIRGDGQLSALAPPKAARGSFVNGEMHTIENTKSGEVWESDRLGSPTASSVDLDGLDAQSQHSGRVGLGGRNH
ncbi:hypothetical protein Cob_v004649 [Colletotrichum orbiculare MAFF 240422]|uniref:Rhodopsin domain-containing protein n=1 Tax=Colletotrichum orbiculare (strain 104-T / ATCC 96160 / CBS 514.97 / LARS 414 / MAFF 240422) TaxID=1213857 RepID=A0A484FXZ1_COLOR|nr:hypothetical protein Cob_v004649 [Colletotrichum orbiculare MAFF 240422]